MSMYPCSNCGQKPVGKIATSYANWFDKNGVQQGWKQWLCAPCLTVLVGSLKAGLSADPSILTVCPMCGKDASPQPIGIWLSIYPPKQEAREFALTMCESCGPKLQELLQAGGERLRGGDAGARAPASNPNKEWGEIPW
jgi:predicted RNA-binding Zn-ribbon protein involved in translation (DUF1610 family)